MEKYPKDFKFERNCPTCNNLITYKSYQGYEIGLKRNSSCGKGGCCWNKGQTKETNESIAKMAIGVSKSNKGCVPWNKGLTKDDHPALRVIGKKRLGIKHTKEVIEKISDAAIKHWKNAQYRELVIERVKETYTEERILEWRKKMEQNGTFTPIEEKTEWDKYCQLVWYYTRKNDLNLIENSELRSRIDINETAHHLDHIYSVSKGYINNVDPKIIGCMYNLRFIPAYENTIKNSKCEISLKNLKKLYYGNSKN